MPQRLMFQEWLQLFQSIEYMKVVWHVIGGKDNFSGITNPETNYFRVMRLLRKMIVLILLALIKVYQLVISPWLGANKCRYTPTCSEYAGEAIQKHGALKGTWLAIRRLLSCAPWGGHGYDPVP